MFYIQNALYGAYGLYTETYKEFHYDEWAKLLKVNFNMQINVNHSDGLKYIASMLFIMPVFHVLGLTKDYAFIGCFG